MLSIEWLVMLPMTLGDP